MNKGDKSSALSPHRLWALLPAFEPSFLPDLLMFTAGLALFYGTVVVAQTWLGPFTPEVEISRSPWKLPVYAGYSLLRMTIAYGLSLTFTLVYGYVAAYNPKAERFLIPLLDVLQSIPVLSFLPGVMLAMIALFPSRQLGVELGAILLIFTGQVWNMAFSFYQSLRTVPTELVEVSRNFRLSPWMSFWRVDVPFAMPQLIWNMMMSMSGSWFFVVASEAISVGNTTVTLPGIGSYIALAIEHRDLAAVCWAIGTMLVVILIYDQILFRPLVAWADRFRFEQEPGGVPPQSWVFDVLRRSRVVERLTQPFGVLWRRSLRPRRPVKSGPIVRAAQTAPSRIGFQLGLMVAALAALAVWRIVSFAVAGITLADVGTALLLGLATLARVVVLIAIASVIWVPIGVWVGTRPRAANLVQPVAQFLAAFPANLLFPIVVSIIVAWRLSPNIWLSPLMILGTQWYILFNVIAGAAAIPAELRAVGVNLRVRGWLWWRRIALPAVMPYYVTGAITASGGSWNASIVAEVASWGNEHLQAYGLGAYIAQQTDAGDFHRIVLGIAVMSLFVVVINRVFWRPLYLYAERKFRL